MKKTAFVLGYAGSVLALVFTMLMILTVPANLASDILSDMSDELDTESVLALNGIGIEIQEQGWNDFSRDGLIAIAEQTADKGTHGIDEDVYRDAARFAYDKGRTVLVSMIVVAVSIVLALLSLIAVMIIKKAPTAGGIMLLLTAFFLLLAAIYTKTLVPTFIATVFLALGGIAVFIPARMNRTAPARTRPYAPQNVPMPPQGGYAPPVNTFASPQNAYVPLQNGYAPPQYGEASSGDKGLPFPEESVKPGDGEV